MKTLILIFLGFLCLGATLPPIPTAPPVTKTNISLPAPVLKIDNKKSNDFTRRSGDRVIFTVTATAPTKSNGVLTYQWYYNDIPIKGETNRSLNITNIQTKNLGKYTAKISTTYIAKSAASSKLKTATISTTSSTNVLFSLIVIDTNILTQCITTNAAFTMCPSTNAAFYKIYWGTGATTNWTPSIWSTNDLCGLPLRVGSNWFRNYSTNVNIGNHIVGVISNLSINKDYYFTVTVVDSNGMESPYSNELHYSPGYPKVETKMNILLLTDGTPEIISKICPAMKYTVLWSTDLNTWTPLTSGNADNWGNVIVSDMDPSRGMMRFYKLLQ